MENSVDPDQTAIYTGLVQICLSKNLGSLSMFCPNKLRSKMTVLLLMGGHECPS